MTSFHGDEGDQSVVSRALRTEFIFGHGSFVLGYLITKHGIFQSLRPLER